MSDKPYEVQVVSPAEAEELLRRFQQRPEGPYGPGPENLNGRRSMMISGGGFELAGEFLLTARDARSGEIEWEHSEKNLVTDWGRRKWMENRWSTTTYISFSPSTEMPQSGRYTLPSDVAQSFSSAGGTPTNSPSTFTKTFSATYTTPGSNRTLGTIALTGRTVLASCGISQIMAFALLTPPKTQTTTQTLEVIYKVSMNPIA